MKKFRDTVWISDEDWDTIDGVPYGRKMTDKEHAAFTRAVNKFWDEYARSNKVVNWVIWLFFVFMLLLIGFVFGVAVEHFLCVAK